jgi:hypothetical protein
MAKKALIERTSKSPRQKATASETDADDEWETATVDSVEFDESWLAVAAKENERSRIQRQMKARRELERRNDEKRLRQLVEDWPFDE